MKSQGKHSVEFRTFLDGVLHNSVFFNRTVYQNKIGDYFINNNGNKKNILDTPQGYIAEFHIRSINAYSINDVMASIQQKLGMK